MSIPIKSKRTTHDPEFKNQAVQLLHISNPRPSKRCACARIHDGGAGRGYKEWDYSATLLPELLGFE
jgi:hypothetical protein